MLNVAATAGRRMTMWLVFAALAALAGWIAFRAYFTSDLLLYFSSAFTC